jgi:hypothetical protein
VQRFARRRPALFLAVAAGAGFAAGRLFRGAKADSDPSAGASTGNGHTSDTSGAAPAFSQGAAGGPTTALPSAPGGDTDEQRRAAELSGFRAQPATKGAKRTEPEGGSTPAPTPYGGASDDRPGGTP